jgi:hypothetical protein
MSDDTPKLVDALWIAPYVGELGRQVLIPHETEAKVPEDEARKSDHWKPVKPAKPASAATPAATPAPTEQNESEGDA